ncbi:MAG: hypothetical protein U0931_28890 [Vulcanimicrobiota bacterium]
MSFCQIAANQSPSAGQMGAYGQARQLQQRIRAAASEMAALDGQPMDLDPRADAVAIQNGKLPSIQGNVTGSVSFQAGELHSLSLQGSGETLEYSRLKGGATAFVSKNMVVVETKDGTLRINNMPSRGSQAAIEEMRPRGTMESVGGGAVRAVKTAVAVAAGALPLVGGVVNLVLGATGWAKGDKRIGLGLGGVTSNLLGSAALGAKFVSIAGLSLAPVAGPLALGALGASAVCAGASAWMASRGN